ncbi:MAG: hypothetical protein AB7S69_09265 [Salinivirgaceae bacterium]
MKKLLLLISLLYCFSVMYGQNVSNVTARQSGNSIVINYDLVVFKGQSYMVDIFCSTDNGKTFPTRVTSASGDIGNGITMGNSKTVTWDALKDINTINSKEVVFKVVAHPTKVNTNIVIEQGDLKMTITKIRNNNGTLYIDYVFNTTIDNKIDLSFYNSKVYTYTGEVYELTNELIQHGSYSWNSSGYSNRLVPGGVPVKGHFSGKGIPVSLDKIARFDFELERNDCQLKDVLLEK